MPGRDDETVRGLVDRIAGKSKEIAGTLVGNEDLKDEGRIQQRKVQADTDAAKADSEARLREAEAELAIEQTELEIERQRMDIETAQEEADTQIEFDRHAELVRVEEETRQQKYESRRLKGVQETSTDMAEAVALRQHQIEEAGAARTEDAAVEAQRAGELVDDGFNRSTN